MSILTPQQRELVALGAALGSNCIPCIVYHVAESKRQGLSEAQIREAIEIADATRSLPARQVLETARAQLADAPLDGPGQACCGSECECD